LAIQEPTATDKLGRGLRPGVRVLLLLSGGIDSPVAGRFLQENGHDVAALHFSQEPFTDASPEAKSKDCAEHLDIAPLWVSRAGETFGTLTQECEHRLYFVLSKRLMLAAGDRLADREGYDAIATGENLGQVSSQTLQNLSVIHEASSRPVLTPLLALDKEEIVAAARELGTYELATGPEMCDTLGPDHPATAAGMEEIREAEEAIDVERMADELVAEANLDEVLKPAAPATR
jgi:thiamine biosynthesis protein ThiI